MPHPSWVLASRMTMSPVFLVGHRIAELQAVRVTVEYYSRDMTHRVMEMMQFC
ncbi:hypothetical protein VIBNIAM115_1190059 [Vibrio nigripulchritudo AM115]|nr:hypothetical protein VIBNIAM115_1190059 [Vibrio nigripulchritudo AM115]